MRKLPIFFISLLVAALGFAAENDLSIESLLPADTAIFIKTEPLSGFISYVKNAVSIFDSSAEITERINSFKNTTGIDPLDQKSISDTGIDTKRSAAMAGLQNFDNFFIFIPVSDGEKFEQAFVNLLLKIDEKNKKNSENESDLYPAVSSYKNHKVSQIGKDVFTTLLNDYFVITSSGEQIHAVIDSAAKRAGGLASDPVYLAYLKQVKNKTRSLPAFIKISNLPNSYKIDPYIDFFSVDSSIEKNKILFDLGVSFNKNNEGINSFLNIFSTGMTDLALNDTDSFIYAFLALNLNSIDSFPKDPVFDQIKELYNRNLCDYVKAEYGIDFKEDFSMYSRGVLNIMVGDIIKNEAVIFVPMTDASKSLTLSRKIQDHLKQKYEPQNLFGYETVGFGRAAYYFGKTGIKNYIYSDQRGFYVANSLPLLNAAIKKPYIVKSNKPFLIKLDEDTWCFYLIKKDAWAYISSVYTNKDMEAFMKRLGNMYLSFHKNGSFISCSTEILIEK